MPYIMKHKKKSSCVDFLANWVGQSPKERPTDFNSRSNLYTKPLINSRQIDGDLPLPQQFNTLFFGILH